MNRNITYFVILVIVLISGCSNTITTKEDKNTVLEQIDYVENLYNDNKNTETLKAQLIGDRSLWVYQPVSHNKYIGHFFEKNKNDDFILYSSSVVGRIENNIFIPEQYVMAGSNKEFAYRAKPSEYEEDDYYWFPEHENVGTVFSNEQTIRFDDLEQNLNVPGKITDVESVTIYQNLEFIYPKKETKLANLVIETTVNSNGVSYNANGEWLLDTTIEKGYVAMLPTVTPLMKKLKTSTGNSYELKLSDSLTDIPESNYASSYMFTSEPIENQDYTILLAETINDIDSTLRINKQGRKQPNPVWLEHRNKGSVQKIYPQIYLKYTAKKGETFKFSANIFTGLLDNPK